MDLVVSHVKCVHLERSSPLLGRRYANLAQMDFMQINLNNLSASIAVRASSKMRMVKHLAKNAKSVDIANIATQMTATTAKRLE